MLVIGNCIYLPALDLAATWPRYLLVVLVDAVLKNLFQKR